MYRKISTIVLVLFAIVSCQQQEIEPVFNFGNEVEFGPGETVRSGDNRVSVKFAEINDSRCPSDVICIWAGEADVKFELTYRGVTNFELSTLLNPVDTIQNLIFTLVDVQPYPVSTGTIELDDYKVKLEIEKVTD